MFNYCSCRFYHGAAGFHPFGKLVDMEQITAAGAHLHMVIVNVAAALCESLAVGVNDSNLPAVGDAEQLLVVAVNEPDASCSVLYVLVQPVPAVAVAVQVIVIIPREGMQSIKI